MARYVRSLEEDEAEAIAFVKARYTEDEIKEFGPLHIPSSATSTVARERLNNLQAVLRRRDILAGRAWIYDNTVKQVTAEEYERLGIDPNWKTSFR